MIAIFKNIINIYDKTLLTVENFRTVKLRLSLIGFRKAWYVPILLPRFCVYANVPKPNFSFIK